MQAVELTCEDPRTAEFVKAILSKIADRWTLLTLDVLAETGGEMRFSQLREQLTGVSQKMLTQTLRQLERDGLVTRHAHAVVPPRVDYRLTPLGQSLSEALCGIWMWAMRHYDDVERARARFDGQPKPASLAPARIA